MKVYDILDKNKEVLYENIPTKEDAHEIILIKELCDVQVIERIVYNVTGLGRDPDLHE